MNGASLCSNSTASTTGRLRLAGGQLLDVLERIPIQPVRTEHSLDKPPPPLSRSSSLSAGFSAVGVVVRTECFTLPE